MNKVKELKKMLRSIPPKWDEAKRLLGENQFTKEELADVAFDAADSCFCEYKEAEYLGLEKVIMEETHSFYLTETLELLLAHGLDPNAIAHNENAMWETQYIDIADFGAKALRLLLEHGGNPNHVIPDDSMSLFEDVDSKFIEDGFGYGYDYVVKCWLVLVAFGGHYRGIYSKKSPIQMLNGHKVEILKKFEQYDCTFDKNSERSYCPDLLIIDKRTKEVVARRR